jgi:hypothetical protein
MNGFGRFCACMVEMSRYQKMPRNDPSKSGFVVKCTVLVGLRFFAMSVLFYFDCGRASNFVAVAAVVAESNGIGLRDYKSRRAGRLQVSQSEEASTGSA